ncbi:MAG: alkaline phosphatase family protein [Thermoleophilia bacterium]|nr:alkaline phosphatase family protein [Thermoleophilia bacterium]
MDVPLLPDYDGASVVNIVPALLERRGPVAGILPAEVLDAPRRVLVVIDGLGQRQLAARPDAAPVLTAMDGAALTTVAPSTTAAALTGIVTAAPPGRHGLIGYRMHHPGGGILNPIRWTLDGVDAREAVVPEETQVVAPFLGTSPAVVNKLLFRDSGFTRAQLRGTRIGWYATPAVIPVLVGDALRAGEPFVHAYWDGIDNVAHVHGHGAEYDAELAFVDRLISGIVDAAPSGTAVVVTADHGHVPTAGHEVEIAADVRALCASLSGEARFAWLHCPPDRAADVLAAAEAAHGDRAWVVPVERILDEGWLGPRVIPAARARMGAVALAARGNAALTDPGYRGSALVSRHGSLTPDEMLVPLRWAVA